MEEDIKILEEFINYKNINNSPYHLIAISHERLCEAIQNLIARYKELEKENLEIRDWKYVIDSYEDLDRLKELDVIKIKGKEYLAKSKVQEKIEDYTEKSKHPLVNAQSRREYTFGIKALQELLED